MLGHAAYGGSDIGEALVTAERITPGDYDGWHDAWLATADRVAAKAERGRAAGHRISARDGFLRSSTYYGTAEFFLHEHPDDSRAAHAYDRSVECFHVFAPLNDPVIELVEIPYENTSCGVASTVRTSRANRARPCSSTTGSTGARRRCTSLEGPRGLSTAITC